MLEKESNSFIRDKAFSTGRNFLIKKTKMEAKAEVKKIINKSHVNDASLFELTVYLYSLSFTDGYVGE